RRLGADASVHDGHSLAAAAAAGASTALSAYRIAGLATGRVIGGLLNVLDPEVVALTGGVAEVGGLWREAVSRGIAREAMDVVADTPVLAATAGGHAALLGAAARALDDLSA
ncbi:MAG: ROK family protein, partial [Brachybacterium sp.]|nr:ROK family protein [Brachybacterium sp.]